MKKTSSQIQLFVVIIIIIALVCTSYIGYYNGLVQDFANTGDARQADINSKISPSVSFIDSMTTYTEKSLENAGENNESDYYSFLTYKAESDDYSLDWIEGTAYTNKLGSLTGIGQIPQSGIDKREINTALDMNDFFEDFYIRVPIISWMYYTSEAGFISIYPWISSKDFKYSEGLKDTPFYSYATPEKDPSGEPVWTPVYLDEAGKGLVVTLSSPIYNGNKFKGVVSVDFTTNVLGELLKGDYDGYLIDEDYNVIASGGLSGTETGIFKLNEILKLSDNYFQEIEAAQFDSVQIAGGRLVFKKKIDDAPWTMLMVVPLSAVFWKAFLLAIPEIISGTFLLLGFIFATNLRKAKELLRDASITDPLTGLKNRRFLDAVIEEEIARSDRYKQDLSIVSLDLDHFKKVNDTWGHPIGDEVLKLTAAKAKSAIRKSDIFVRVGGEEFIILLPQTGIDAACEIAERARKAIEEARHPIAGKFTASFGVVERLEAESYNNMYRRADEALYRAKDSGRNCVKIYEEETASPSVKVKIEWNRSWESGEAEIDGQHHKLLELGNSLIGMASTNSEDFRKQLDALIQHIIKHFDYEERVQKEIGYPDAENHTEIHRQLIEKAKTLRKSAFSGETKPSVLFSFVMDDIIVGHLLEEDTKFFPHIKRLKK